MDNKSLIGKWVSVDLPCFAYNFLGGGKGYYSLGDAKKEFSYVASDISVTIHYTGDMLPASYEYFIEENVLSIQDSFGNYIKYKRE